MIDRATGDLVLDDGTRIGPALTLRRFRKSGLIGCSRHYPGAVGYDNYVLQDLPVGMRRFHVMLQYARGELRQIGMSVWDERLQKPWDRPTERKRREVHDAWLKQVMGGPPPYEFGWGEVASDYVDRDVSSEIFITYREELRERAEWNARVSLESDDGPEPRKRSLPPLKPPKGVSRRLPQIRRKVCTTDAGLCAIWDPSWFPDVDDYDAWEAALLEDRDLRRHIREGHLVPLNIQSDGTYAIEIRIGSASDPAALPPRSASMVVAISQPYCFRSNGWLCFGGVEHVSRKPAREIGVAHIPKGTYAVRVHRLDRSKAPKSRRASLPDFVALVNPARTRRTRYRTSERTFR